MSNVARAASLAGPEPPLLDKFLSTREVAEAIGVGESTLYRWAREAKFPPGRKVGAKTFWPVSEVARWMEDRPTVQYPPPQPKPEPKPVLPVRRRRRPPVPQRARQ